MRDFSNGFFAQAKTLFTTPKHLIMLALLIFMSVVTAEVYRGMVLRDVPVAILDLDQSSLSRTLVRMVDATREVRVVHPPFLPSKRPNNGSCAAKALPSCSFLRNSPPT